VFVSFYIILPKLLAAQQSSIFQDLQKLKMAIANAKSDREAKLSIAKLAPALGIRFEELYLDVEQGYYFSFAKPISTQEFCQAMGWSRPYAIAVDVHQQSWRLVLWKEDLPSPYGPRIVTNSPRLGKWLVDVELQDRPEGQLPNLSSGASPAYDLWTYRAEVAGVRVELSQ
jgi:hypothetical protein